MIWSGVKVSLVLAAVSAPASVQAQACAPPEPVTSVSMLPVAGGGARMLVPVSINGSDKNLLLDTAGGRTALTEAAARGLNLRIQTNEDVRLLDTHGNASHQFMNVDTLMVGDLLASKLSLMVTPDPKTGIDPPLDGILAPDLMNRYDVEIDFAARKLNYYSQTHCAGATALGSAQDIAAVPITLRQRDLDQPRGAPIGHSVVLFGGGMSGIQGPGGVFGNQQHGDAYEDPAYQASKPSVAGLDIRMPVTLDGKVFTANIDTGSENSTLNTVDAKAAFDVTAGSPDSAPAGGVSIAADQATGVSETVTVNAARGVFEHTFHTLAFGGVMVVNPHFTVRPDLTGARDVDNDLQLGSHIHRADDGLMPDITIGMNVLRHLHLYFAFKEGKLYVTAADANGSQTR